ncbi:MAG: hypothetical protein ABI972_26770 [Acidobacteriota bacterium]
MNEPNPTAQGQELAEMLKQLADGFAAHGRAIARAQRQVEALENLATRTGDLADRVIVLADAFDELLKRIERLEAAATSPPPRKSVLN